jgi:hypothetical protein
VPTTAKAQLFVTVDYDTLTGRLAAQARTARPGDDTPEGQHRAGQLAAGTVTGSADAGTLLAPETVRRIACDAALIPAVLGTGGEVLDWGRERRLFTPAQVKRLWLRDGGCTYPGCATPAQWCDAHHLTHWADGGPTSLENAALLCGRHHPSSTKGDSPDTSGPDPRKSPSSGTCSAAATTRTSPNATTGDEPDPVPHPAPHRRGHHHAQAGWSASSETGLLPRPATRRPRRAQANPAAPTGTGQPGGPDGQRP